MDHKHTYDKYGKQLCCTQEEKINFEADKQLKKEQKEVGCCATDETVFKEANADNHSNEDGHDHSSGKDSTLKMFLPAIISLVSLLFAIVLDNYFPQKALLLRFSMHAYKAAKVIQ